MDRNDFTENVLKAEQTLYRISMSMLKNEKDCEDAVQEAIATAFGKLKTLKHDEYFTTWLVRILINECNRQLNRRKRVCASEYISDTASSGGEKNVEIRLAIERLPIKIRQVVVLRYIEDFTVKETASILKIPAGTVKSRLAKGRELLKLEVGE